MAKIRRIGEDGLDRIKSASCGDQRHSKSDDFAESGGVDELQPTQIDADLVSRLRHEDGCGPPQHLHGGEVQLSGPCHPGIGDVQIVLELPSPPSAAIGREDKVPPHRHLRTVTRTASHRRRHTDPLGGEPAG